MARVIGSCCAVLLACLCVLGGGSAPHSAVPVAVARSVVEVVLRDVADAPRLAPRASATLATAARLGPRTAAAPLSPLPRARVAFDAHFAPAARLTVARQATAYATRRRWRAYDAAAPPAPAPQSR